MPGFDFLARIARLSAVNLTIREQTRLLENPLDLRYRALFPEVRSNSLKIRDLTKVDFRPTGEYRAWNAQGRQIHEVLGPQVEWELLPVTAEHHIDERRLLELSLPDPTIRQLVDNGVINDVDSWATVLADSVERRLEVAAFQGWLTNQLTFMDPKTGSVVTAALGISALRYVTEATIWSNGAVNAYDRFVFHATEAKRFNGTLGAARMRNTTMAEIVKDAPLGPNGIRPTILNIEDRLREQNLDVTLIADERTYDKYTDGGNEYTTQFYVPTGKVAFQPADGSVGGTYTVPIIRAKELVTNTKVNRNDVVVWYTEQNDGKTLKEEAERVAVPMVSEARTYVVDAGV